MTPYVQWCHFHPFVSCVNICQGQCTCMEMCRVGFAKACNNASSLREASAICYTIQPFSWPADIFAVDNSELEWAGERHIMTYQWEWPCTDGILMHSTLYCTSAFKVWHVLFYSFWWLRVWNRPDRSLSDAGMDTVANETVRNKKTSGAYCTTFFVCKSFCLSWLEIICCCMEAR